MLLHGETTSKAQCLSTCLHSRNCCRLQPFTENRRTANKRFVYERFRLRCIGESSSSASFPEPKRGTTSLSPEASTVSSEAAQTTDSKGNKTQIWTIALALVATVLVAVALNSFTSLQGLKSWANRSILGRSGFLAAFSLIFLSEIGDKTFFIAALLAARVGKWKSFIGSTVALAVMTIISVAIGTAFKSLPDFLTSTLPIGQYLGAALMLVFGIRTIADAWQTPNEAAEIGEDGELREAELSVSSAERDGKMWQGQAWQTLLQVGTLIFLAEWGDRSMLATIALGASHPPAGVALGASIAHAAATGVAVVGGALASQRISEKTIAYVGGGLFLLFSGLTFFGCF